MELLPCPFCGGEALPTAHLTYNWFAPVCGRCNARGPSVKIERDSDPQEMRNLMNQADENWNRRASPASAPEGWKWRRHARTRWEAVGHWDSIEEMAYNDMLGRGWDVEKLYSHAAPTPPVSEDRKDAERYRWLRKHGTGFVELAISVDEDGIAQRGARIEQIPEMLDVAIDAAMKEDKS